jgi:hypothetical protein
MLLRATGLVSALGVSATLYAPPAQAAQDVLAEGFRKPPDTAKPHTWWHWMDGNVTREGITADLEEMKRVGMGGAQIFHVAVGIPKGPVDYLSPQWREMIVHAAKEVERLGLELCIHNCAGWSSSGGPWITPEHAMQVLAWSEKTVHGPATIDEVLPQPKAPRVTRDVPYYRDIAVFAFRTPAAKGLAENLDELFAKTAVVRADGLQPDVSPTPTGVGIPRDGIVVLTDKMDREGRLTWDVPEGDWTILRLGHTPTGKNNHPAPPEAEGLEVDKLSREALDTHWAGMMAKIIEDLGPLAGKALNNVLIDSYEVGDQNWTPKLREEFLQRRGYDLLPFLPVIAGYIVDTREASERFLWDFRRTIADLFADNYYGYFAELCHKHGMRLSTEPYGNGGFDDIQSGSRADIPMGEFWIGGGAIETTKLASSIGHTYGRRIIGAESFTATDQRGRYLVEPFSMKALGDLVFCNGVNRYIFHRYAHQPWMNLKPGMTMGPWGTHLERTVTWWDDAPAWLEYVARCQYLLQEGQFVADACYFCGEAEPVTPGYAWSLNPQLPAGYDYDGCDTTVLLERMSVRDGRIVLPSGMSYGVLVLPDSAFMTPEMARKIKELVSAGATVVGPKPRQSPSLSAYPACDEEVRRLAEEVWGDVDGDRRKEHASGKGRVIWGQPLQEVFAELGIPPDMEYTSADGTARAAYIHRVVSDADIYFVSNQLYWPAELTCTFRVSGKAPELWHPDTGAMEPALVYREEDGRTIVPLQLGPAGSVFVVFRRPAAGDHVASVKFSPAEEPTKPRLVVTMARYETAEGAGGDVTEKVAEMVANGQHEIPATNAVFGDPAPDVAKHLRVQYVLDGKPTEKTVGENETLLLLDTAEVVRGFPPFELSCDEKGRVALTPWLAGEYEVTGANGRAQRIKVTDAATALEIAGPWTVKFPPNWGAPASVEMERLISWPEHPDPGVRYFSGTAEYVKEFDVPADMLVPGQAVLLDLGTVKNLARVRLNGRDLGILWKLPFRVDVAGIVKPSGNRLEVSVTNLWPNRLIGDEQLPPDVEWAGGRLAQWPEWLVEHKPRPETGRCAFVTWRFYTKDSRLLESGLLGPVTLRSAARITVEPQGRTP